MSRKSSRRIGSAQLEEMPVTSQQSVENMDTMCDTSTNNNGNSELIDEKNISQLTSSMNTSLGIIPKTIPINEADMICTTVENVSHVRFEWTVEDFYPQMYECGDMIQSEEFPPYDLQKEFWTLRLYPKGHPQLSSTLSSNNDDDESSIQFYLTLCPSHITSNQTDNSNQLHLYFRALINFSNPQGRIFHTETVHDCGGNIINEIVLMKMTRAKCEELYKESKDHLIVSIELMSIDDITKRSLKICSTKIIDGTSRVISKVMKMKLRWKIERFSTLITESSNHSYIESCEFTFNKQRTTHLQTSICEQDVENEEMKSLNNDIPLHQWSLILYPNGKTERFKESLSLFLEHTFGPSVRVVIRFSLIDERGRRINTKQLPSHILNVGERWGIGDFIKHITLLQSPQQLIPNNELRLYCQIKILERQSIDEKKFITRLSVPLITNKSSISINDNPALYWPKLFYTAYLDKQMFDMYLRCGNELFPVHKLILALRSTVFAKIIKEKESIQSDTTSPVKSRQNKRLNDTTDLNSQTTNGRKHLSLLTIDINDIDQITLPYLLEYIYTGGIKNIALPGAFILPSLIIDLLTIATNYDILDLRNYAECFLKDIIRVNNACELLALCDNTKSDMLKQVTCDFIANNLGHIMETSGWTELKVKQPDLIDLLLKSCLLSRK